MTKLTKKSTNCFNFHTLTEPPIRPKSCLYRPIPKQCLEIGQKIESNMKIIHLSTKPRIPNLYSFFNILIRLYSFSHRPQAKSSARPLCKILHGPKGAAQLNSSAKLKCVLTLNLYKYWHFPHYFHELFYVHKILTNN